MLGAHGLRLCDLRVAGLGIGAQAGFVGLAGASLQADAVGLGAGGLDAGVQHACPRGVGGDFGALGGNVGQVVGLGLIVLVGPVAVGAGQCIAGLFELQRCILGYGRVGTGTAHGTSGLLQCGGGGGAGASGQQARSNQAGGQGSGTAKNGVHGGYSLKIRGHGA